jgi:hypothetical protein
MFEVIDTGADPSDVPVSEAVRAGDLFWSVHISEDPVTGELRASLSRAGDSRHGAPFTRHPPGNPRHCGLLPGLSSSSDSPSRLHALLLQRNPSPHLRFL